MGRKSDIPIDAHEFEQWLKTRRSDCIPILRSLAPSEVGFNQEIFAWIVVLRRQQIWSAREVFRRSKNPRVEIRRNRYNLLTRDKRLDYYREKQKLPSFQKKESERQAKKYLKYREKILNRNNLWEERNKDYVRGYMAKYVRVKRKIDPNFNIRGRLGSRIAHALRNQFSTKSKSTEELVGCSVVELRSKLESQFTEGMTWEKFLNSEIHIDHRIPCAGFDLTNIEEQRKCFHWSNLQPLWAIDNLRKGAKLITQPLLAKTA